MLGSIFLVAALALAPGQAGGLKLSNVRNTYGELGGARPEGKFLPGDIFYVGFDIENLSINDEGQVAYEMAMEVLDKDSKAIFEQKPAMKTDFVPLGGAKLPARAFISVGIDQEPGTYTLKLTVKDLGKGAAKANAQTLSKSFEVSKKEFGIVAVNTSVDDRGAFPSPTTGIVGQSIYVQFGVVSFERAAPKADPKSTAPKAAPQPDLTFEMVTLDSFGKPTIGKPVLYKLATEVKEQDQGFAMRFFLPMTRAGKFTVRLKATDNISKKESTFDLPITVVESGN